MPLRCMALAAAWEALPPLAARCAAADGSSTSFGMRAAGSIRARPIGFPPVPPLAPPAWGGQITRGGAEKPARPSRRLRCAPPREASLAVLVQQRRRAATSRSSRH